jgi:hypothetical protein
VLTIGVRSMSLELGNVVNASGLIRNLYLFILRIRNLDCYWS